MSPFMNPVEKRILQLAGPQVRRKATCIRQGVRKGAIDNRRDSWQLVGDWGDLIPSEAIILDVDLKEAIEIDRSLEERFNGVRLIEGSTMSLFDTKEKGVVRWKSPRTRL